MKNNYKNGFTLLLSVLITSIILGIAIGFPVFIMRELAISAVGRESQKAFFAADSGVECVLYWDNKQNAFATTTTTTLISCAGSNYRVGGSSGISNFTLNFANGSCAYVIVDKTVYRQTKIDSYGRNTCSASDPNRVERALEVIY